MGLLRWLFGRRGHRITSGRITYDSSGVVSRDSPLAISKPTIGYLNLIGDGGRILMKADRNCFDPLFCGSRESNSEVPECDVLLIYANVEPPKSRFRQPNQFANWKMSFAETIQSAGAYIAILAAPISLDELSLIHVRNDDWKANVVLTVDRKGVTFCTFFHDIFDAMKKGESMMMAWARLAPQTPYDNPHAPACLFIAGVSHIVFTD